MSQSYPADEIASYSYMRCGCLASAYFSLNAQLETHVLLHVLHTRNTNYCISLDHNKSNAVASILASL